MTLWEKVLTPNLKPRFEVRYRKGGGFRRRSSSSAVDAVHCRAVVSPPSLADPKALFSFLYLLFIYRACEQEFPELVDYLTWLRATLAFVYGIWIGVSSSQQKSRAMANIILAFNLVCFMPLAYTMTYLRCDQESYGAKLIFAGVPQGLALVLLVWIYLFTESHGQDEAVFAAAIAKSAVIHAAMGSSSSDSLGENPLEKVANDDVDTATQTTPESEF